MYDELVKALRGCVLSKPCDGCPYYDPNGPTEKCATMNIAAADAIEELSRENKEIMFRANQLEAMNDALIGETGATDALMVASKPRWVPVTEALPERGENVLVANKRGKQWDIDKAWLSCLGSGFDRCGKRSLYHVTHWMPLPEPPKEG